MASSTTTSARWRSCSRSVLERFTDAADRAPARDVRAPTCRSSRSGGTAMRYLDEDRRRATRRSGSSCRRSRGTGPSCANASRASTAEWRAVLTEAFDEGTRGATGSTMPLDGARRARDDVQPGDHARAAIGVDERPRRAARLDRRMAESCASRGRRPAREQTPRALARPGGLRRARRRADLLRGLRQRRADGAAAADLVDHPLPPLEDADPVPRAPLPGAHVRRPRQRPLRPAGRARRLRRAASSPPTRSR